MVDWGKEQIHSKRFKHVLSPNKHAKPTNTPSPPVFGRTASAADLRKDVHELRTQVVKINKIKSVRTNERKNSKLIKKNSITVSVLESGALFHRIPRLHPC